MIERKAFTVNNKLVVVVVAVVAITLTIFSLMRSNELPAATDVIAQSNTSGLEVAPVMGALAPDFTLFEVEGEQMSLSDFRGQPVLINFWATWCGPCRLEMPAIQERFERYKDEGFVVLAVDFDETASDVRAYGKGLGLTFSLLLDPGAEVQKLYRNRSYPSSFFVDAEGVIQVQHIGVMTEGQIDENLAKIGLGP
jgi:cytochrome c biogenesis protein CcmG/thiol:disulfide interchange protein DsbE